MATTITDVIIIGAGASGLTAAHDLIDIKDTGLNVKILEARDRIGGRVAKLDNFCTPTEIEKWGGCSPLDLGGEWLAYDKGILDDLAGYPGPSASVQTVEWRPTEYQYNPTDGTWDAPQARQRMEKFVNSTWFDFFDTYIATETVRETIEYGCAVNLVDYTNSATTNVATTSRQGNMPVTVRCGDGRTYQAQQVIVTVPIPILQNDITFIPPLADDHQNAIDKQDMLHGMKVIIKFSEKFYHDVFFLEAWDYGKESGRYFYNPFYGQPHDLQQPKNILINIMLGDFAAPYTQLSPQENVELMIQDLQRAFFPPPTTFGGAIPTQQTNVADLVVDTYVQNWNTQRYSRGVYSNGAGMKEADQLREPIPEGSIIFAGEAYPPDGIYYGYVHGAALSGRRAADLITAVPGGGSGSIGSSGGGSIPATPVPPPPADVVVVPAPVPAPAPGQITNPGGFNNVNTINQPTIERLMASTRYFGSLHRILMSSGVAMGLSDGGPYTFFAPSNGALPSFVDLLRLQASPELPNFLWNHVVAGQAYTSEDLQKMEGQTLTSIGGATIEIRTRGGMGGTLLLNDAMVTSGNMIITTGIVHMMDQTLFDLPNF